MGIQENLQVVKQVYGALGKGDIPAVMELLAEDIVWEMPHPREVVPYGGQWQGHEGVEEFFHAMHENAQFRQVDLQEYIAQGDKVIVLGHVKVLAKPTEKEYENDLVAVWTVEDGKVKQMRDFMDTAPAVSAFEGK